MTSILLPSTPLPRSATPRPLDFGAWLTPPLGGAAQRLDRLGNRFAIDIVTPNLKPEPDSRIWASRLVQAVSRSAIFPFPQPGFEPGAPGRPVVDGAGQAGESLALRGFTPNYFVREGHFFSIFTAGRNYLYVATQGVQVDHLGKATVPIWPMLRRLPADGDACQFGRPLIEGAVSGAERGWTHVIARTQGLTFTIAETE